MSARKGHTELIPWKQGQSLIAGQVNTFSDGFPLGSEGIRALHGRLTINLTSSGDSAPVTEGPLLLVKGISLRSDRGDYFCNNVPLRALYKLNTLENGTPALYTTWAASTAAYYTMFTIPFSQKIGRQEWSDDTIFDSSRYRQMTFDFNLGSLSDILTVGSGEATYSLDLWVERQAGVLPAAMKPVMHRELFCQAPVNPASLPEINIEKASDLIIKQMLVQTANSASAGVLFSGTPADTTLATVSVDTSNGYYVNGLNWGILNAMNKYERGLETALVGYGLLDFTKGGSNYESVRSLKDRFRLTWTNGTLSTSQVSVLLDGMRTLKG